jgi:hypothetical protein
VIQHEVAARFSSRVEADLARSLLRDHGIEAHVTADDVGGLHPELSMVTGGVGLVVPPEDVEAARALLGEGEAHRSSAGSGVVRARRRLAAAVIGVAVLVLLVSVADAFLQGGLMQL